MSAPQSVDSDRLVVLLADDDPFMRSIVANVIRSSRRYDVVVAGTGREAVERLGAQKAAVGIALLDFVMPDGNGLEVAQRIRAGATRAARDLPIAMLTGRRDYGLVQAAMELDVNAYVVKPVTRETLFARLDRARSIPFELRPPEDYRRVDIPSPWGPERPKKPPPAAAPPAPPAVDAAPRSERVETRVADLVPGMILAASVRGNDGQVILPARIRLDRALVARLSDLAEMGAVPATVFILGRKDA